MSKFHQTLRKQMVSFLVPFLYSCTTVAHKLFSLRHSLLRRPALSAILICLKAKVIPILAFVLSFVLLILVSIPLSILLTCLQHAIHFSRTVVRFNVSGHV